MMYFSNLNLCFLCWNLLNQKIQMISKKKKKLTNSRLAFLRDMAGIPLLYPATLSTRASIEETG